MNSRQNNTKPFARRKFLQLVGCGIPAFFIPCCTPTAKNKSKTNFIIILADDLGYGDVTGFGTQRSPYQTSQLARMAAEGVRLTSFYSCAPYCAPSRASLLTGRYPFRNGVVFNPAPDAGINDVGLPESEITIAEALKNSGYATKCIGKWHLGHTSQFLPRRQGFDEYFGILYSNDMRPVQIVENEAVVEYPVVQANLTKKYTEKAIDFIERCHRRKQPFFLYLAHAMPHKPLAASEAFYTPETPNDLYGDVIRELDWSVGQIIDKVRQLDLDSNTMILFLSDNGPWFGGDTGGLRGMKAQTWEGGLRVPFIARWPGAIPAGVVNDAITCNIDIFPTIMNIAGVVSRQSSPQLDGKDIWKQLTSAEAQTLHEAIFAMHGTNLMTVRSGKWKLHVMAPAGSRNYGDDWVDPRGPDGVTIIAPYEQARPSQFPGHQNGDGPTKMMLFDMENDREELHDVSKRHPEVVKRLEKIYNNMMKDVPKYKPPQKFDALKRIVGGNLKYEY